MGVNDPDVTDTGETGEAGTATVDVNTAVPVHDGSSGPYRRNVTDDGPDGLLRPVIVATSPTVPPSLMSSEARVAIDGVAFVTTVVSPASPQEPADGVLLASPEYEAIQR